VAILDVTNVVRRFGGLVAVNNVSFAVEPGEILAIIGPNGAGKTTLFSLISGFLPPDTGRVLFDGADITGVPPHRVAARGLVRSFQLVEIFAGMTVLDAITAAALLRLPLRQAIGRATEILERLNLASRHDARPGELSLQDRKLLELGKCLATDPKLILLDEVMAGLTLAEAEVPMRLVGDLREAGITFVLVEHVMPIVMKTADRIIVLNFGEKIAEGTPAEIVANQGVRDAYFGEELDA
jgi:branched-chain amino acid transport system ATP-binding protein